MIGARILGMTMPIILGLLRLEPRVAAGPIALAGADMITILMDLSLALWRLGEIPDRAGLFSKKTGTI